MINIHVSPSAAEAIPVYFVSVGLRLMSAVKDPVPLIDKCRIVQIVLSIWFMGEPKEPVAWTGNQMSN